MNELVRLLTPDIDRVSVYRTIELFVRLGIAQKVYVGWKYRIELTEEYSDHHHHLLCTTCGTLTNIRNEQTIEAQILEVASRHGYKLQAHQLEIQGLCPKCALL